MNYGSFGVGIYGKICKKGCLVEWFIIGVFLGFGNYVKFCGK